MKRLQRRGGVFGVLEEMQVSELHSLYLFITLMANTPRTESSAKNVRLRTCFPKSSIAPADEHLGPLGWVVAALLYCVYPPHVNI